MSSSNPNYQGRNLILCFDGTGNSFNTENTNVVRLFSALDKKRTDRQLCYYQPGIGTYVSPAAAWSKTLTKFSQKIDYAIAWYLDQHIMGGYRFLMQNYTKGDRICIFGFSRGAYTARCLAGMLHKVGLLPKSNEENVTFAYHRYVDTTPEGLVLAQGFKAAFSMPVDIEFMGVWDTVASVGLTSRHLPFTSSNTIIRTFRQGLSLDERRVKFLPNPWHKAAATIDAMKADPECGSYIPKRDLGRYLNEVMRKMASPPESRAKHEDGEDVYFGGLETDVEEVWFAGGHTDVGGGSVTNSTVNNLANTALIWMLNEIVKAGVGLVFKQDAFSEFPSVRLNASVLSTRTPGLVDLDKPSTSNRRELAATDATVVTTAHDMPSTSKLSNRTASTRDIKGGGIETIESVVDIDLKKDSGSSAYDALANKFSFYWLLEYFPMRRHFQDANGHWHKHLEMHMGKPRVIEDPNPKFHDSVRLRMENDPRYSPRAKYTGKIEWVGRYDGV